MDKIKKFVNVAVTPQTRDKLRRLAKLMCTNLNLAVELLADREMKKILAKNINIDKRGQ